MGRGNLTGPYFRVRLGSARAHTDRHGGIEGSYLPQGSGDGQSPEDLHAQEVYAARMWLFENGYEPKAKRRVTFNDYRTKNCEEAWGNRS